jgi:hypothetical protein
VTASQSFLKCHLPAPTVAPVKIVFNEKKAVLLLGVREVYHVQFRGSAEMSVQVENEGMQQFAHNLAFSNQHGRCILFAQLLLLHNFECKRDVCVFVPSGKNSSPSTVTQNTQQIEIVD